MTEPEHAPGPRRGPGAVFLGIVILIALLLHVYPAWRLLHSAHLMGLGAAVGSGTVAALVLIGLIVAGHAKHVERASTVGDIWLGVVFQVFVWTLLTEPLRLVLTFADVSARGQITAILAIGCAVVALSWGLRQALGSVPLKRVTVQIAGLSQAFDGLRIVQITDTHLSPILGRRWMAGIVDRVNALEPDVCVHTGDLADGQIANRDAAVAELDRLNVLDRFYITGNHEYFSDAQYWGERMTALGFEFLHNRHVVLRRDGAALVIAGIDDLTAAGSGVAGHGAQLGRALDGKPEGAPVVLLAHQPKQVRDAVAHEVDLQLAGHTHGGQMWPFHYLVRADQKYLAGLHRAGARTQIYVSRGTGFWGPPFRIGAPPELTEITLRSAKG